MPTSATHLEWSFRAVTKRNGAKAARRNLRCPQARWSTRCAKCSCGMGCCGNSAAMPAIPPLKREGAARRAAGGVLARCFAWVLGKKRDVIGDRDPHPARCARHPPAEVGCFRLRPHLNVPNSGKPEFGASRGRDRGLLDLYRGSLDDRLPKLEFSSEMPVERFGRRTDDGDPELLELVAELRIL